MYGVGALAKQDKKQEGLLEISDFDLEEMRRLCKPFFEYYDSDKNNKLSRIEFSKY